MTMPTDFQTYTDSVKIIQEAKFSFEYFIKNTIQYSKLSPSLKKFILNKTESAIYGAGNQALFISDFFNLIKKDIAVAFTSEEIRGSSFERIKLPTIKITNNYENKSISILIATSSKYNNEIINKAEELGFSNIFYSDNWDLDNSEIKRICKSIYIYMINSDMLSNVFGVISLLGGSFKDYLLNTNVKRKVSKLKNNLDIKSCTVIDEALWKMQNLPEDAYQRFFFLSKHEFYPVIRQRFGHTAVESSNNSLKKTFKGFDSFPEESFIFHHGLSSANEKIKNYIKGKIFIDCGAFIGDSAVVLIAYYAPKKLFAFDLSEANCEGFRKIMELNSVSCEKFDILNVGISDKNGHINMDKKSGIDFSPTRLNKSTDGTIGALTSIDIFCSENKISDIGFVKFDIEGFGYAGLRGMKKTICQNRPVLSLAMYHSPQEFFEMKPLLEKITQQLNYKITVINCRNSPFCLAEVGLFAYPAELD